MNSPHVLKALGLALVLSCAPAQAASTMPVAAAVQGPGYDLELPEAEIQKLIQEIESQGLIGSSEISINSLRHPGDKAAYDQTVETIAKRMQWAIFEFSEVKRNVIRYSVIVNQAHLSKEKVMLITDTSSKISQEHYRRAIWSIAGAIEDENAALRLCISEVCAIEIADAFEAVTHFSESIDRDLDFRKLNADRRVFWHFEHPILRASFSKAFRNMISNNHDHNAYKIMAAGIFTPLSVAGVTTFELLKAAGSAVFNPRYSRIKLEVDEVKIGFKKMYNSHKGVFQSNYQACADGSRAKAWIPPVVVPASSDSSVGGATTFPQGMPNAVPGQDKDYWLALVKGSTRAEKEPCARMALPAAADYDLKHAELRAQPNQSVAQAAEVDTFFATLRAEQLSELRDYAGNYQALAAAGRSAYELQQLDAKMQIYMFNLLQTNLAASESRFFKAECQAGHDLNNVAHSFKTAPASWAGRCYNPGSGADWLPAKSMSAPFLMVSQGIVKFWACSEQLYGALPLLGCASVDLVTGEKAGLNVEDALRDPMIKARQGVDWFGQSKEEYVRSELPACF